MTTTTASPFEAAPLPTTPRPLSTRVATVVRLLFANLSTAVWTPLMILGFIFLMNVAIFAILRANLPEDGETANVNGGAFFVYVYMLVVAVMTINQAFPLSLGYGSTRRDFLLGFGVFAFVLSIGYSLLLATAAVIEGATNGWGLELGFFSTGVLWQADWWQAFAFSMLGLLLFFGIGAATAAVYVRWKAMGMYVFWGALVVLVVGGAVLVTWLNAWGQVGAFFAWAGVLGSAAWSLIITGFCALAAWLILRRATPSQG